MYHIVKLGYVLPERDKKNCTHDVQKNLLDDILNALDGFEPQFTSYSICWVNWISELDLRTCLHCRQLHGQIFSVDDIIFEEPLLHERCRCRIESIIAVWAGYATLDGADGADFWLAHYGKLPEYYITKAEAKASGWKAFAGNLHEIAPNKMIGGDIYNNRNGHLPVAEGRVWYEADINYTGAYRRRHRILYSNDGLIFVTYDHYETFWEVV